MVEATASSAVAEGEEAQFTVTLSATAATNTVLAWSTAEDTAEGTAPATSGTDFTAVSSRTLTIAAGDTSGTLPVTTLQDDLAEDIETFTVTVTGTTLPDGMTLGTATATGTIEDDDELTVDVAAGAPTVAEGGTASFAVTVSGGTSTATVNIPYDVQGTATAEDDYTAPSRTLTLAAGDASGTIAIAVLADDVLDPGETLIVTLAAAAAAADVGTVTVDEDTATTTITDTGTATVSVAATADSTVAEGGAAAFTVTLSGKAATETVLGWSTASGAGTGAATSGRTSRR